MASCYGLPPFPAMNTAGAGQMQGKKKKKQITLYTVHFRGYYRFLTVATANCFQISPH